MNVAAVGAGDDAAERGSFVLGLLAGFIGGALFLALFYGRSKRATRSGILWGLMLQLLLLAACWHDLAKILPGTR